MFHPQTIGESDFSDLPPVVVSVDQAQEQFAAVPCSSHPASTSNPAQEKKAVKSG